MSISIYKSSQEDLELAPRDLTVMLFPIQTGPPVLNLEDPTTGNLVIPNYAVSVGNFTKRGGVKLGNKPDIVDIESHGKGTPTRQLPSKRPITLGLSPQETKQLNLSLYWGADYSGIKPSVHGGVAMIVPELPMNIYYRAILLGQDDYEGLDVYPWWSLHKVMVGQTDDQDMIDTDLLNYPFTLTALSDGTVGSPMSFGVCGPGWLAIQQNNHVGFGS